MTQKHQLKTIPCITYYFMLGWNLSACINSLYKLRWVGDGRGVWEIGVIVFLDGLLSVLVSPDEGCWMWMQHTQRCFAEILGGVDI